MEKPATPLPHSPVVAPDIAALTKAVQMPAQAIMVQVQMLQMLLDELGVAGSEAQAALVLEELRYALPLLEQCAARSVARVQAMAELIEVNTPLPIYQRAALNLVVLVRQFVERRLPTLLAMWHGGRVEIQLDVPTTQPVWIIGDAEALMHVLEQLVANAADALAGCAVGTPGAEQPQIWLRLVQHDQAAILTLADNGPGFPRELLGEHVQISGFVPQALRQSGLGLRSVLARVRRMGGTVTLSNEPPAYGAVVTLEMPALQV